MVNKIINIKNEIAKMNAFEYFGSVTGVQGMLIEVSGVKSDLSIGDRCEIIARRNKIVECEVVGFRDGKVLMMPFGSVEGIGPGCKVNVSKSEPIIYPDISWLGRVINAKAEPVDKKGPLIKGKKPYFIYNQPPSAHQRKRIAGKVDLGIRAMNTFLTLCKGQRMGIFAGSGIGKSSLMAMMAMHTKLDISIIGLIGERGREAREFIEDSLGEEGLARSVIIVATSDECSLLRKQAAYIAMAVAEYFRDEQKDVLCMMDSVTRFAMAQREISLSAGEPPASKGYTPSVFAELPKILERAGQGTKSQGSITGLFTVLVEGDDHNEPISDAVRGIVDGHIILDRSIAERGRYPAINILRSVSRTMPDCNSAEENKIITKARKIIAVYEDMAELIRLGAYKKGSNAEVDEAIIYFPFIEAFLAQDKIEVTNLENGYKILENILNTPANILEKMDSSMLVTNFLNTQQQNAPNNINMKNPLNVVRRQG
jgi:flagellum-specific ATP synthase